MNIATLGSSGLLYSLPSMAAGQFAQKSNMGAQSAFSTESAALFEPSVTDAREGVNSAHSGSAAAPMSTNTQTPGVASQLTPSGAADVENDMMDDSPDNSYVTQGSNAQESATAFQEYVKAWGGRIIHGEVELPPLSIYVE